MEAIVSKTTSDIQEELTLDEAFLLSLGTAKNKLNATEDASKIEAIARMESKVNSAISKNTINLVATPETENELLKRVADKPSTDLRALERNDQLSELEKVKKSIELNQAIVKALEIEKKKVMTLSSSNPSNEDLTKKTFEISQALTKKKRISPYWKKKQRN